MAMAKRRRAAPAEASYDERKAAADARAKAEAEAKAKAEAEAKAKAEAEERVRQEAEAKALVPMRTSRSLSGMLWKQMVQWEQRKPSPRTRGLRRDVVASLEDKIATLGSKGKERFMATVFVEQNQYKTYPETYPTQLDAHPITEHGPRPNKPGRFWSLPRSTLTFRSEGGPPR